MVAKGEKLALDPTKPRYSKARFKTYMSAEELRKQGVSVPPRIKGYHIPEEVLLAYFAKQVRTSVDVLSKRGVNLAESLADLAEKDIAKYLNTIAKYGMAELMVMKADAEGLFGNKEDDIPTRAEQISAFRPSKTFSNVPAGERVIDARSGTDNTEGTGAEDSGS